MNKKSINDISDFKLERYKYILQQLNALNENTHKYLTLFQTLATAIVGGGIVIFISWRELKIDAATARVGLQGVILLLIVLTLFVITSVIAGIFSWMDYRREEVRLFKDIGESDFRTLPKWRNFWRWHEFYVLIFFIVISIIFTVFVQFSVIPLII